MGAPRVVLGAVLLALAGCGGDAPRAIPEVASPSADAVAQAADAVAQAVDVWEQGADGIPPPPADPEPPATGTGDDELNSPVSAAVGAFHDFDEIVRGFLAHPSVKDAVQFSCAVSANPNEHRVERGLEDADPLVRLRALVVLVRVRAPRTVDRQWAVLEELRRGPRGLEFAQVTTRVAAAFAPEALDRTIAEPSGGTEYQTPPAYQWAIRAAGVTRHRGALPRLTELTRSDELDVSLAAERSLEDFEGEDADAALAACVRGWKYDAAQRAATALQKRDPERLREALLASSPAKGRAYWKGVYLARLDDRRGVPILCEEVPGLAIIDREIFDAIARLAGPEDLAAVEALPGRVRDGQKARANEVLAAVRTRLGR